MEIMQVVLELSPDLILTLNRHVLPVPWVVDWITRPCLKAFPTVPVPWVVDWITRPCLKAFPTDGFSPLITEEYTR